MLCTTRGEGGEVGEPPVGPKSRLGEFREAEMRNAARALGARDVAFLDFVDPWMEIGGEALAIDATPDAFCAALAPTTSGRSSRTSSSPTARTASTATLSTSTPIAPYEQRSGTLAPWRPHEFLTWCANDGTATNDRIINRDDPADLVVDITPWFDRKLAAVQAAHQPARDVPAQQQGDRRS